MVSRKTGASEILYYTHLAVTWEETKETTQEIMEIVGNAGH